MAISQDAAGDAVWKCALCGRETTGKRASRRSSVLPFNISTPGSENIQSQCANCGYTMCSQCLELQKPGELMPDRETLCPGCGKSFGDGPILLHLSHPDYMKISHKEVGPRVEEATFNYVRDLKTWAWWLLFWSVINTGILVWGLMQDASNLGPGEFLVPTGLGCLIIIIDLSVFVSAIVCLTRRLPWAGFYIIFAVYLTEIGLFNLTAGGIWFAVGVFQLGIAISLCVNWFKYRRARGEAIG